MADQYNSLASARQGASSLVGQGLKILEKLPDKPIMDENGNVTGSSPGGYRVQMPNGQVGVAEPGRNSQNGTEYVIQMPSFNSSDSNNQGSEKYFVNINPDGQTAQVVNSDVNETPTQGFWQNNDNLALVAASLVGVSLTSELTTWAVCPSGLILTKYFSEP